MPYPSLLCAKFARVDKKADKEKEVEKIAHREVWIRRPKTGDWIKAQIKDVTPDGHFRVTWTEHGQTMEENIPVKDTTDNRMIREVRVWVHRSDFSDSKEDWSNAEIVKIEHNGYRVKLLGEDKFKFVGEKDIIEPKYDPKTGIDLRTPLSDDPAVTHSIAGKVLACGLFSWGIMILPLGLGLAYSKCSTGAPWWLLIIPFLTTCVMLAFQRHIMNVFEDAKLNSEYLQETFQHPQRMCSPTLSQIQKYSRISLLFNHRLVLQCIGFFEAMDLSYDAVQIGQARSCDVTDPHFHAQYVETWDFIPPVAYVVQHLHFSGLLFILLASTYLIQLLPGVRAALKAIELSEMTGRSFPIDSRLFTKQFRDEHPEHNEKYKKARCKSKLYENLAVAAEWAFMCHAAYFFREVAAKFSGEERTVYSVNDTEEQRLVEDKKNREKEEKTFQIILWSKIRVLVLENLPTLWLNASFFSLEMDHLHASSKVKLLCLFAWSAGLSVVSAQKMACAGRRDGAMVAVLILTAVALVVWKYIMAFHCESHFFNFSTFQCVPVVRSINA